MRSRGGNSWKGQWKLLPLNSYHLFGCTAKNLTGRTAAVLAGPAGKWVEHVAKW
jgi:hypothetical protein